ncbi:MAG: hypothetical protein HUJ56_10350, partial [Erysipelotrichaceae bacterium]|nr:hypothetical protein [Erysipelotrichaceae bacterium]
DIQKALLTWRTHFGDIYDGKLRVGKFENNDFPVRGDTDIFKKYVVDAISRTTYEPYFNSKYGTALNAWNAGHFNCYDGMLVVMALASAFGLGSSMRSGYWGSIPHVWAYVEGVGDVDATAIQGGYGLTSPKVSGKASIQKWRRDASGETTTNNNNNKEINLTLNFDLTNSYVEKGVEEKIGDIAVRKVADLLGVNPATGL